MLVTAWLMTERAGDVGGKRRLLWWVVIGTCALPSIMVTYLSGAAWYTEASRAKALAEKVRPVAPRHPRVLAISERYAFVPVARALGGAWVGSTYFQIISWNAHEQLARHDIDARKRAELEGYARFDRAILANDIRRQRPDVILVDGSPSRDDALSHPEIADAMRAYHQVRRFDLIAVWLPRDSKVNSVH
jgi:hypothetical protein